MSLTDRTDFDEVSAEVAENVDEACDRFEREWKAETAPRIEEFLNEIAFEERDVLLQELVRVELAYRHKLGQTIVEDEYLTRFPSLNSEWLKRANTRSKPKRESLSGVLGDFQLQHEIGRGGMGVVYAAVQISLGRRVAVKVLPSSAMMDSRQLRRFQNESRAAASLHHPHIVPVYAVGSDRGVNFFAMQLIEGHTLSQRIKSFGGSSEHTRTILSRTNAGSNTVSNPTLTASVAPPTPHDPVLLMTEHYRMVAKQGIQVAEALEHAHSLGVVHRDIKPSNLMVDRAEKLWVTDFGLARIATDMSMTISGDMLGTLRYMSPEQALAKHGLVDHRTDIYSLGVTLYELLTLRPAIDGKDRGEILQKIAFEEPPAPRKLNPKIPLDLETIVLKAIAKEPHLRYQTAEELADDLRRFTDDQPIKARRRTTWQTFSRWQRRNRALSAALMMSLAVIVVANGLVTWKWREERLANSDARLAEQSAKRSERLAREAEAFAKRAELQATQRANELQKSVYLQQIARSEQEWWSNNVGRAEQILDRCQPELRHWEWGYLKRLCTSEIRNLTANDGALYAVAFAPDGRHVYSGGQSGKIHVWDIATGTEQTLSGHTAFVHSITFSPDGKRMASTATEWVGSVAGEVKLWDVASGQELVNFPTAKGTNVTDVAFSPDGRTLALATWNHTVQLIDLETNAIRVLSGYGQSVKTVVFTPDGRTVIAGGWGGQIMTWDVATGKNSKPLLGHRGDIVGLAIHPNGKFLASSSWDSTVRIWDLTTKTQSHILTEHHRIVFDVAFSPDGNHLASASDDGTIGLWETGSWKSLSNLRGHDGAARNVSFSPGGSSVVSAGADGRVKLWDLTRQQLGEIAYFPKGHLRQIAFHPKETRLVVATQPLHVHGGDGWLVSCDPRTGQQLSVIDRRLGGFRHVAFDPDGKFIAADWGHKIRLWDATSDQQLRDLSGHDGNVSAVATLLGGVIVSGAEDGTVKLWRAETGELLHVLDPQVGPVTSIVSRLSGDYFAVAGNDGQVAVWRWTSHGLEEQQALRRDVGSQIRALACSSHDNTLAAACEDGHIYLWNLESGAELHAIKGHVGAAITLSFSADGRRLASGGVDGTVVLWDTHSGQEALTLRRQLRDLSTVTFAPNGDKLVAASDMSQEIRIWDSSLRSADDQAMKLKNWHLAEAKNLELKRRWNDVEVHLSAITDTTPNDIVVLASRGHVRAEQKLFESALQDYRRLIELSADQPLSEIVLQAFWSRCLLQWETGDKAGYRETCRELAERLDEIRDSHLAGWATKSFWLLNDAGHVAPALRLAENFPPKNFDQAVNLGVLQFVAGEFAKSAESFVLSTKLPKESRAENPYDWLSTGIVYLPVPAMSLESLLKSRMWLQKNSASLSWRQRLEYGHLQRIAEQIAATPKFHEAQRDTLRDRRLEAVKKLTDDINNGVTSIPTIRARGNLYAELEQWPEAVADFARICEMAPMEMDSWYRRAAANLGANDIVEHARVVAEMLKQYGSTQSAGVANSLLYVLTINPQPLGEREQLMAIAQLALNALTGNERLVAATQYRVGDIASAVESFEKAAPKFAPRAWDWCFLAMCRHRLGDRVAATANFKLCDDWIAEAEAQWKSGATTSNKRWFNWQERAEVLQLRREAAALVESPKASD